MRKIITVDPLIESVANEYHFEASPWPAKWIGHPTESGGGAVVLAFRRVFELAAAKQITLHVSADQRYEMFLDGNRIGQGPERGDMENWFYETYELDLSAGRHVLVVRVTWLGADAPLAQITFRPAFILLAENEPGLSTGASEWEVKSLRGYSFSPPVAAGFTGVGARTHIDGNVFDWGYEKGEGGGWIPAITLGAAAIKSVCGEAVMPWKLRPAILPAMRDEPTANAIVRHVTQNISADSILTAHEHLPAEAEQWTAMLGGRSSVTIPPHTIRRVILDWNDYLCGYGDLILTGGRGATVKTLWAESLYDAKQENGVYGRTPIKGNRDEILGKLFLGMGATFTTDGGAARVFTPIWWDAGRYVAIDIATGDTPLTIDSYRVRKTGYPFEFTAKFASSDARLARVIPTALRTLEMCSHETYMDCPYYEQLMYVGDTRLEVLTTYATTADDRLPRKAIELFDASRSSEGWTTARYPCSRFQRIPTFSLWWICTVHDYAMWRGDLVFVRDRMAGVRAVLEAARQYIRADGLFECPPGWNFVDWVRGYGWDKGIPPGGVKNLGVKGAVNWQAVIAFQIGAELESLVGDADLAARNSAAAQRISAAALPAFWDERRGLLAEDLDHKFFGEHSQCLAVIADVLDAPKKQRAMDGIFQAEPGALAPASVYFAHYLFEACRLTGRIPEMLDRMQLWLDLPKFGLKTVLEAPEPSRSDCHAWGAHPVFHYHATILGIRPQKTGMSALRIEPQLGPLEWAAGELPHPAGGMVKVDVRKDPGGRLRGVVTIRANVSAVLVANGTERKLRTGENRFE